MPARKSVKTGDGGSAFGPIANVVESPDGAQSPEQYNRDHGRKPNAPTSGGDRQAAYDALLDTGGNEIPAAYLG